MRRFLKIAVMISALAAMASCAKDEPVVTDELEILSNNIAGKWELAEWNGAPLEDGLYMHLELIRRDRKFSYTGNINGAGSVAVTETGRYDLFEGDVISFLYDNSMSTYGKRYIISELTSDRMVWTLEDDPDDVSVYVRMK